MFSCSTGRSVCWTFLTVWGEGGRILRLFSFSAPPGAGWGAASGGGIRAPGAGRTHTCPLAEGKPLHHGSAKFAGCRGSRCGNGSDQMGLPSPRCLCAFVTRACSFRKGQAKKDHVRPAARPGELLWQPAAAPDPPRWGAAAAHVQCAAEHALRCRRRPPGAEPAEEQAGQRRRPAPLGTRRPDPPQLRGSRLLLRQAGPLQPAAQGAAGPSRQQQRRPAPPPEAPAAAAAGVRRPPVPHVPRSTAAAPDHRRHLRRGRCRPLGRGERAGGCPGLRGHGGVACPGSGGTAASLAWPRARRARRGRGTPAAREAGREARSPPPMPGARGGPAPGCGVAFNRELSSFPPFASPAQCPPRGPARDRERRRPAGHSSLFAVPAGSMCAGGSAATAGVRPRAPSGASNVSSRAVGEGRLGGPEVTRLTPGEVADVGSSVGRGVLTELQKPQDRYFQP